MALREELIGLFIEHSAEIAVETSDFDALKAANKDSPTFRELTHQVEQEKLKLEENLEGESGSRQLKEAMQILNEFFLEYDPDMTGFRTCSKLVQGAYYPHWNKQQQEHFQRMLKLLGGGRHWYFLSFTNRNPTPESISRVNRDHRYFIEDVFTDDTLFQNGELTGTKNLLAAAINKKLRERSPITGYFDQEREGKNYKVTPELKEACRGSATMVQIIQAVMFGVSKENYCLLEYGWFKDAAGSEPYFLHAEPRDEIEALDNPKKTPKELRKWLEPALEASVPVLTPTPKLDEKAIVKNHATVDKLIVDQVSKAFDRLFDQVPED